MKHKFTDKEIFDTLESGELLIAHEMIRWQIQELLDLQWELNQEQTKIMTRFHELENESEGTE